MEKRGCQGYERRVERVGRELKKPKYKEVTPKKQWIVIADYQPSNMWSRPDDRKISRHETVEEALCAIEEHKKNGASVIEVFRTYLLWEMK